MPAIITNPRGWGLVGREGLETGPGVTVGGWGVGSNRDGIGGQHSGTTVGYWLRVV